MSILVKFDACWADEFDVKGFKIFESRDEFNSYFDKIKLVDFDFGTNEVFEAGDIYFSDFEITDITQEEVETLTKLFGSEFGLFP